MFDKFSCAHLDGIEMETSFFIFISFLASVSAQYGYSNPSVVLTDEETGRIRGFSNITGSDFYLGGLMRIHFHETEAQCGNKFPDRGLEEVETMLFAIDSINNDPHLLPNITLGYDIRDYCGTENVAIDEVLDWALSSRVVTSSQECELAGEKAQTSILAAV